MAISEQQFFEEINKGKELWPMPKGPEAEWTSREHQAAANHYFDAMGRVNRDYPNYRPTLTALETSYKRHTRYAQQLRAKERGIKFV